MRRLLLVPALPLIGLLLGAACSPTSLERKDGDAEAQGGQIELTAAGGKRMELVNNARRGVLQRLEVAPIENREQFREVAAARGLAAGAEKTVRLGAGCVYDMRATMASGAKLAQYRVDVCFRDRVFLLDWPAEGEPPMAGPPAPEPQ